MIVGASSGIYSAASGKAAHLGLIVLALMLSVESVLRPSLAAHKQSLEISEHIQQMNLTRPWLRSAIA